MSISRRVVSASSMANEQVDQEYPAPAAANRHAASLANGSAEGGVHGGCEQGSKLSDVVEIIDAEDGFLDGGLAFG
jgi:hypothetical protein